jgi:hypothetical protein
MNEEVKEPWWPRASSSGYYWGCSQRAAFDRAIHEGKLTVEVADTAKPNAALGTVIHFILQDGMRAMFPGPSKDFAPTPEEYEAATSLFGGNRDRMIAAATASARSALAHVPVLPPGVHWLAEPTVSAANCPKGHVDLISSDGVIICDLKTTRIKPTRIKRAALIQLASYCLATGARKVRAIYVDSLTASWCVPIDVDFDKEEEPAMVLELLPKLVQYWTGGTLFDTAYPQMLGDACGDDFCPYTGICRDKFLKKADVHFNKPFEPLAGKATL